MAKTFWHDEENNEVYMQATINFQKKAPLPYLTEEKIREDLALTYTLIADLKMDDLTYTHLSVRNSSKDASFFINPFGYLFEDMTPEKLIELDFNGQAKRENSYNKTGFRIHGDIYKANPHLNAIIHLHTTAGIAVSALKEGLLPLSQFAFHFYERAGYHEYDGLALDEAEGEKLARLLARNPQYTAIFLRNHGTIAVGKTLQEAFFYAYYLEQACKTQIAILSQGKEIVTPSPDTCRKARDQMRAFEPDLGKRDWTALVNKRKEK